MNLQDAAKNVIAIEPLKFGRQLLLGIAIVFVLFGSFTTIDAGTVGVPVTFGQVGDGVLNPGFHLKLPFFTKIVEMSTRLEKHPVDAAAASKDLQQVSAEVTVPFSLRADSAPGVYQKLGSRDTFKSTIIDPGVMESVKAVTAQFSAEQLVTQRERVKAMVESYVKSYIASALAEKKLSGAIDVGTVAITHFDFSAEFNKSIEQKVKAEQDALRAENQKRQKITEAEAERDSEKARADGESYAIEVRSKADAAAIQRKAAALQANPALIQLNAVDKWNGQLPQYMTGGSPLPFINLK